MNTNASFLTRILKLLCVVVIGVGFTSQVSAGEYTQTTTAYDFVDISATGTGTGTVLIEDCDDCARAVNLGFQFTYYGRVYTQLYVSANGFIVPGGSAPNEGNRIGCCNGGDIPSNDNVAGFIALWWADL